MSALTGRRHFMEAIADGRVAHAGTYNTHPVCLGAAQAGLEQLAAGNGAVYRHLFALGEGLRDGINRLARAHGSPLHAYGPGPMVQLAWGGPADVKDLSDVLQSDAAARAALIHRLAARGVRVLQRGMLYVSAAHTRQDVDVALAAIGAILAQA